MAIIKFVTDCARRDGQRVVYGGLQHGGMETQHALPIRGCALGEENYGNAIL